MKQVAQRPRDGQIEVVDAPLPALRAGWVLVANRCSLISAGTERSKVEMGEKNLLQKARARPELVRQAVDRARTEGIGPTIRAARERLDALAPLGYSSAGTVLELGSEVEGFAPGDGVACGGGGFANHAEVVAVPRTLVARIPEGVSFERAAYATVGAVALHSVRRAEAAVGERIGVIGLGLVGQLAMRLLTAAGCTPVGIDLDPRAVELARTGNARAFQREPPDLVDAVLAETGGLGLDAVLVCAESRSQDPMALAGRLARERGRIVVVGDVPVQIDRSLAYEKELEVRLSRSYGPGRHDRDYEERGRDLPPGYVRWTEQRNMQAFLELVAAGSVDPSELTTHRFPVDQAARAYAALTSGGEEERAFGVVLEYAYDEQAPAATPAPKKARRPGTARVALIGAGSFARRTLIPALQADGADLVAIASERGLTAADAASRFGFGRAATEGEILADESIDAIVIATRHANHAALAAEGLRAGKAVFVEKPLALDHESLADVESALTSGGPLMVGFNRRFAPLAERLHRELEHVGAPALLARVNAGPLPADHWLHDPEEGGGRLLGEACHFVDLLSYLADSAPVSVYAVAVPKSGRGLELSDDVVATLRYANGAVGTLLYSGSGDASLAKERIEAFGGGLAAVLDDFRRLELHRNGKRSVVKGRQDKGHRAEIARFLQAVRGEAEPPPAVSYLSSTSATLALADSLRAGNAVSVA
jgi:predicted dehydrogenase/threonine dehydrogenase-like Zn-dependent dehydrogenase